MLYNNRLRALSIYHSDQFAMELARMHCFVKSGIAQNKSDTSDNGSTNWNIFTYIWQYIILYILVHIQGVQGGKVNILGDHSIGNSKKKFMWTCVLFRTVSEIELFDWTVAKLLIRKRYYVLCLIFIVQVTNLLLYNKFSKIPPSTSMRFASHVRTWRVARLSSSWRSFMRAIASIIGSSSSSHVFNFLLYTSLFI
jgi:hypothetical protein